MKKTYFICGNLISTCHISIMMYFQALGDFKEKEITEFTTDNFYLNDVNEFVLPINMVETFFLSNISTDGLKAVYVIKDPRFERMVGTYKIPNKIVLKKEERSYSVVSYDNINNVFNAKRYYLNRLVTECTYDKKYNIVKYTHYGLNSKTKPLVLTVVRNENGTIDIEKSYDNLKKSEYDKFNINPTDGIISSESRRIFDKESYILFKNVKKYSVFGTLNKNPKFDMSKFNKHNIMNFKAN